MKWHERGLRKGVRREGVRGKVKREKRGKGGEIEGGGRETDEKGRWKERREAGDGRKRGAKRSKRDVGERDEE